MQVRDLDQADREALHAVLPDWFALEVQCSPGAWWPTMPQLTAAPVAVGAEVDGELVGCVTASSDGRISWLCTKPGHSGEAFAALGVAVYERCGDSFGHVHQPALRELYLASLPGVYQFDPDDPAGLRWSPP